MGIFQHHGICDECGEGLMVERVNSQTGNTFLGCSEFPDCKHTKRGGENPAPVRVTTYPEEDYDYYGDGDDDFDDWGEDIF